MRLIIMDDDEGVSEWAAMYVMKRINEFKPTADRLFVLGLPTGGTPKSMYKRLVDYNKQKKVSFKYVRTFNMDEYVKLDRAHKESYHAYMFKNLFSVSASAICLLI
jgi:glucosamine-6-phosphate deaminase